MTTAVALGMAGVASAARADSLVDEAKAVVEKATSRADKWDGPTSGPKAVAKKTVVYVAGDMRNGGILGVAHGLKEASDLLDAYLNERLEAKSFGTSVDRFVFCSEIADFEKWDEFFQTSTAYTSYRPKRKELWSVGQLRWSDVKDLQPSDQIQALRVSLQAAIHRIGTKPRKPKDFAYLEFAATIETMLAEAAEELLMAKPAA
jgi:hypothetical protein